MMLSFARICFKDDKQGMDGRRRWKNKLMAENRTTNVADDDVVNSIPGLIVEAKRV